MLLELIAAVAAAGLFFNGSKSKSENSGSKPAQANWRPNVKVAQRTIHQTQPDEKIEVLVEYELVRELVKQQFPITFVTGGAGTGKSTFVKWLIREFDGQAIVLSPTGIAALNVGGQTIHSFCKLPPRWIVKTDVKPVNREAVNAAKLLIIDEISMVNANVLDAISHCFVISRREKKPFGGIPVVLVGDLFQLSPVVESAVRPLFDQEYSTEKFFSAHKLKDQPYYAVELKKAYRQVDQEFADLLANLREGLDIQNCLEKINSRCLITQSTPAGAVCLCATNQQADIKNTVALRGIQATSHTFIGRYNGRFKPTQKLPSPERLILKVGAQVVVTKNAFGCVNGTIGVVEEILERTVKIKVNHSTRAVEISCVKWSQYEYMFDDEEGKITPKEVGSYEQIPLALAWAITIHKSQGQTIEKVHIDLGSGAFASGQTYVALSRCRSLDAMTLSRRLTPSDIIVSKETQSYYATLREAAAKIPPESMLKKLRQHDG